MNAFIEKMLSLLAAASLVPGLAMAASAPAPHNSMQLMQATAGDQVPDHLVNGETASIAMDHAPVQVSWALSAKQPLQSRPQPFQRVSRHYLVDASGAELEHGVAIPLSGPGAILRISPRDHGSAPLNAGQVHITAHGRRSSAAHVSSAMAASQVMARAGMSLQSGSVAMRLDRNIAAGTVQVDASGARGRYVVQVTEPQSPYALKLAANHDTRLAGQPLELHARLDQPGTAATLDAISGVLEAPDGWSTDISFSPRPDRSYTASVIPPVEHAGRRGLWQVHVFASGHDGQRELLRDATNAFAAVRPTARLNGALAQQVNSAGQGMTFDIGIESATASRYAISAILYGHNADGQLKPAVYAQSAAWLKPGEDRHISLRFDAAAIARSGLTSPFELHDLRLDDQVQLGLLERRQVAARNLPASN